VAPLLTYVEGNSVERMPVQGHYRVWCAPTVPGAQRHFACLQGGPTSVSEGLIVPIETDGVQLGAIWAMSHSKDCRFEREDVRLLTNLAVVAGAALTVVEHATSMKSNENDMMSSSRF